jgi:hypothetical protein
MFEVFVLDPAIVKFAWLMGLPPFRAIYSYYIILKFKMWACADIWFPVKVYIPFRTTGGFEPKESIAV